MTDWLASGWAVHEVTQDLRLQVTRDMPQLDAALDAEVDAIWQGAQRRLGGTLFNGRVFSADQITADLLSGHWTEFRRIVAQMERPDLFPFLSLRPTATGGLLMCADGVVFGRRPERAVYQAGQWQLPPAGSIDPGAVRSDGTIDVMAQVLTELSEELGLDPDAIARASLLCIVEHQGSHVLDLGVALWSNLDEHAIRTSHAARANAEYTDLMVVPHAALACAVKDMGKALTPQARVFLIRVGLLNQATVADRDP